MSLDILAADVQTLSHTVACDFQAEGARAIAARGRFTIAIPGGSVASAFFPALADLSFDWARTDFFWIDERAVAPDDPDSNYRLAHSLWLKPAHVPISQVHRMPAENVELEQAARTYADELRQCAGDPPILDFVLLGVGEDGHVASVFPGHAASTTDLVAAVTDAPKPPPRRLTLTLPVLTRAERTVVAAFGTQKSEILRKALSGGPDTSLPVATVLRSSQRVLLLVDERL